VAKREEIPSIIETLEQLNQGLGNVIYCGVEEVKDFEQRIVTAATNLYTLGALTQEKLSQWSLSALDDGSMDLSDPTRVLEPFEANELSFAASEAQKNAEMLEHRVTIAKRLLNARTEQAPDATATKAPAKTR